MDQVFVPEKANKLVIRVKMDASSNPSVVQDNEMEFNPVAIVIFVMVILLMMAGGYYYSQNNENIALTSSGFEPQRPAVMMEKILPEIKPELLSDKAVDMAIVDDPVVDTLILDAKVETIVKPVQIVKITPDVVVEESINEKIVETPALVMLKEVEPVADLTPVVDLAPVSEPVVEVVPDQALAVNIKRAQFTNEINNREPMDKVEGIVPAKEEGVKRLYFFTELVNLKGQAIRHQWLRNNKLETELKFDVGGNRWRVNSSKRLNPRAVGNWQVNVINEAGNTLISKKFEYK